MNLKPDCEKRRRLANAFLLFLAGCVCSCVHTQGAAHDGEIIGPGDDLGEESCLGN